LRGDWMKRFVFCDDFVLLLLSLLELHKWWWILWNLWMLQTWDNMCSPVIRDRATSIDCT
jgi:hypothetical protein